MRLEHFHYIVEIARCKSMSKASKKLVHYTAIA